MTQGAFDLDKGKSKVWAKASRCILYMSKDTFLPVGVMILEMPSISLNQNKFSIMHQLSQIYVQEIVTLCGTCSVIQVFPIFLAQNKLG